MKILVLDNYDSFTYNLVHIIRELGYDSHMDIFRNDKISLEAVDQYDKILLSPGPGIPEEAGIMMNLIKTYAPSKSILGICLGHQGIAEAFNGKLYNMPTVLHGIANKNILEPDHGEYMFEGLPNSFMVCRYHSWAVQTDTVPDELIITARDEKGEVMGLRHREYDVKGLQFHPESVLTEHGIRMLSNWLKAERNKVVKNKHLTSEV
jgi:anthranilate synthase component II